MDVAIKEVRLTAAEGLSWTAGENPDWANGLRFSVTRGDGRTEVNKPCSVTPCPFSPTSLVFSLIVKCGFEGAPYTPVAVITMPDLGKLALGQAELIDTANVMFRAEAEVLRRLEYATATPKLYDFFLPGQDPSPKWLFEGYGQMPLLCELRPNRDKAVERREIPYLLRAYVPGKSIDGWAASEWRVDGEDRFNGLASLEEWFNIAQACAEALDKFHLERIIHGDICPENMILDRQPAEELKWKVYFINGAQHTPERVPFSNDFMLPRGQPATLRRIYDDPGRLYQYDPFLQSQSGEVVQLGREGFAEWYSPADIYSLGMVLYYIAVGDRLRFDPFEKEEPLRPKREERPSPDKLDWSSPWHIVARRRPIADSEVKRTLLRNLQQRCDLEKPARPFVDEIEGNQALYQYEARLRIVEVLLSCLRGGLDTRAPDLRAVLTTLKQFRPAHAPRPNIAGAPSSLPEMEKEMTQMEQTFKGLESAGHKLLPHPFAAVLCQRLDGFTTELKELTTKGYMHLLSLSGNRYDLVSVMDSVLLSLGPGDVCQALTTPTFWFEGNMGPMGRVTSALQIAALRGAAIEWLIVVDPERLTDRKVADVLEIHRQLQEEYHTTVANVLKAQRKARKEQGVPPPADSEAFHTALDPNQYEVKWAVLPPSEYLDIKRRHRSFVSFRQAADVGDECVFMAPSYRGDANHLTALRLWVHCRESGQVLDDQYKAAEGRRNELTNAFKELWPRGRSVEYYAR